MTLERIINNGRKKFNNYVKYYGNKIKPYVFTGPIIGKNWGLGDILTYRLHRGHAGAVIGLALPTAVLCAESGYDPIITAATAISTLPISVPCAIIGYITGMVADAICKKK